MFSRRSPCLEVNRSVRCPARVCGTGRSGSDSSMKYETLFPSAAAIFIRLAIVGVMPLFSILWIAAGESPARSAGCRGDPPPPPRAVGARLGRPAAPRARVRELAAELGHGQLDRLDEIGHLVSTLRHEACTI